MYLLNASLQLPLYFSVFTDHFVNDLLIEEEFPEDNAKTFSNLEEYVKPETEPEISIGRENSIIEFLDCFESSSATVKDPNIAPLEGTIYENSYGRLSHSPQSLTESRKTESQIDSVKETSKFYEADDGLSPSAPGKAGGNRRTINLPNFSHTTNTAKHERQTARAKYKFFSSEEEDDDQVLSRPSKDKCYLL